MSVYSGFATRQQQHKYNSMLQTLVIALKKRIIKFYQGEACDEDKFKLLIKKIYKKMFLLQKGKFMQPKYSTCFTDLIESLSIQINYDTMSECSSMMSQTFSLRKDSADFEGDQLRSNALLSNKRNLMEVKAHKIFNSTLSLNKKEFQTLPDPEEEERKPTFHPRSSSLTPVEHQLSQMTSQMKSRQNNKMKLNEIKNLREMRGTMNMPKVQNFLPKKQQVTTSPLNPRRNTFLQPNKTMESPKQPPAKVVFRRQKYSKAQIKAEDI